MGVDRRRVQRLEWRHYDMIISLNLDHAEQILQRKGKHEADSLFEWVEVEGVAAANKLDFARPQLDEASNLDEHRARWHRA